MGAQYFDVFSNYATMKELYDADELTIRVRSLVQGDLITPLSDYESLIHSVAADFGSEDDSMFKVIGLGEDLGDLQTNGYQNIAEMAISNGWQVGKHGGMLADIENYRRAAVAAGQVTRLTLEHSSPGEPELGRIRELGYEDVVGINLSTHAFLGRGAAGRVCDQVPFRTVYDSGLHAGIGTDSTNAQPSNPWVNIYFMVTGKDVKGFEARAGGVTTLRAGGGGMGGMGMGAQANAGPAVDLDAPITCPDERVSRAEAVQLYTKGSAWLASSEDDYGVLEAGKLADLVVLSDDIFSTFVSDDEIPSIRSVMTLVDGEIVYLDEDAGLAQNGE
jgi:predicted amidohydrolase YtcJ